jgi:CDP-diacylglycerol--glycerol-3-phosphate 3-phosphatidyltransferase
MEETSTSDPDPVTTDSPSKVIFNIPNQITVARLFLSIACFAFLGTGFYLVALILFALAAGTDWIDGYWARRYQQITQLGRILDPFADKFLICGVFIFLAAVPKSEIVPWMAVLVVAREMLVTGIRSFFEEKGVDFSASWAGKWKMVFQCAAVLLSLFKLTCLKGGEFTPPASAWLDPLLVTLVWIAIAMTVYSGWGYVRTALRLVREA